MLSPEDQTLPAEKAQILWQSGKRDEAMKTLEETLAHDPDNVAALAERGVLEARLKRFEAARDDLEEAREMNPVDQAGLIRPG